MGLMYAWATKEYLLWEMTLGQIVVYYNEGLKIKYSKPSDGSKPKYTLRDKSHSELKAIRDELRSKYGKISEE